MNNWAKPSLTTRISNPTAPLTRLEVPSRLSVGAVGG